eukprot:CAMPEP_0179430498 /NCGR_PEP_ID=MMETSP0799-20121207/15626_1 /TAXON_ID=46947 /ORGANISM="Geminigera cryophila, Strain CCMP2564" /LENGTH=62 /DNA_ID=CAMNT_0021206965 /DNA_START=502 /DNA_END=690 /DNA_ORIENTATION=-
MFEVCRHVVEQQSSSVLEMLAGKWASHVSYSNDVMLVDEKTNNPVEYMSGKPVAELPDTAPY